MKTITTKKIFLRAILFLTLSVLSSSVFASPRFIFIEVCETRGGGNIGAPADYDHMYTWAEGVANQADMEIIAYRFEIHQISEEQLSQFLNQLDIDSDDTVFFYYSGHGFNAPGSNFTAFRFGESETIFTMDWIESKIESTGPRLQIVMYEACNHQLNRSIPINNHATTNKYKYRKLFAEARGSLKFSSNSPGYQQYSYGNSDSGSAFTNAYINAVDKVVREANTVDEATWSEIVSETIILTEQFAGELNQEQIPIADNNIVEGNFEVDPTPRRIKIEQINNFRYPDENR